MTHQRWFGAAVLAAAVTALPLLAPQVSVLAQGQKGKPAAGAHEGHHAEAYEQCAKACSDCQRACDSCAHHCAHLLAEGKKEHLKTLRSCEDCASVCVAAAQIVARHGLFADLICKSCAEACVRCGKACAQHPEDQHMKACADECRRCEQACRSMLQHLAAAGQKK
jgi:hypothetical protein